MKVIQLLVRVFEALLQFFNRKRKSEFNVPNVIINKEVAIYPIRGVSKLIITGAFPKYVDPKYAKYSHNGVDFACAPKAEFVSICNGTVIDIKKTGKVGVPGANYVNIKPHNRPYVIRYLHCYPWVAVGMEVRKNHTIGYSDNTGRSGGHHQHFECVLHGVKMPPIATALYDLQPELKYEIKNDHWKDDLILMMQKHNPKDLKIIRNNQA